MQGRSSQPFGKRNRVATAAAVARPLPRRADNEADPHRAFFAAAKIETEAHEEGRTVEVPRSLRAAVLAGLVVACGLAGLDATGRMASLSGLIASVPGSPDVRFLAPALIFLAVLGGGRSAATSLLLAHGVLGRVGQTSHLAYALGGGAAAAVLASAIALAMGQAPLHGFVLDTLAGAAGGFFYRVFAGTRVVASGPAG